MIIDIHPHVISDDVSRYPPSPIGGTRSTWSSEHPVTCEQFIASMDGAGVDKAAVVQASTVYGHDNSYLADCLDQYGPRLAGVCSVDFSAEDSADSIRKWISGRGFSGVRLFTAGSTMSQQSGWLDGPSTYPAWQYVADERIPVCVQMTGAAIGALRTVLTRFPGVTVIIDHLAKVSFEGGPPFRAAAEALALGDFQNVYVKVTTDNLRSAAGVEGGVSGVLGAMVAAFGADHLAWGSNYPRTHGSYDEVVATAKEAASVLAPEDAEWFLWKTATTLYPVLK